METPLFKKSKFDHEPVESFWLSENQPRSLKFHIKTIQTFKKLPANFQLPSEETFEFFISATFMFKKSIFGVNGPQKVTEIKNPKTSLSGS